MKADNEQVFCDSTPSHKDDVKPSRCHENNWNTNHSKKVNEKKTLNGILCDSRDCEGEANHVADVRDDDEKEDPYCITAYTQSSAKGDSFEKDSGFYMNKSVVEYEMPDIVVCYKENIYCVVKDICVDEGVPVQDKFLSDNIVDEKDSGKHNSNRSGRDILMKVEEVNVDVVSKTVMETGKPESRILNNDTGEVEEQSVSSMKCLYSKDLMQKEEMKDDLTAKMSETDRDTPDVSKSSAKDYADAEVSETCDSEDLIVTGEVKNDSKPNIRKKDTDMLVIGVSKSSIEYDSNPISEEVKNDAMGKTRINVSKESLTLGDILSMENNGKSSNSSNHEPKEQSLENLRGNRSSQRTAASVSEVEDSNNSSQEVLLSEQNPDLVSAWEKSNSCTAEEQYRDKKYINLLSLSSVSTSQDSCKVSFHDNSDINSGTPLSGGKTDDPQKQDSDNYADEDSNVHRISSEFRSGFGDTSFSAVGPVSGLITYSGPIAYSGSLSVRSDSSTTSTRSFAFPILQSEWNSSPVRMAKADRRRFRRDKGWRQTLLCCRF